MKLATNSKILYADDDVDDRYFLSESLISNGVSADVVYVENGQEAIDYLETTQSEDLPSLIILDLNMPKLNGKDTLNYIKTHPHFSDIPVVILSTSDSKNDKEFCQEHGASSYFKKPYHHKGYDSIVKSFVSFVEGATA